MLVVYPRFGTRWVSAPFVEFPPRFGALPLAVGAVEPFGTWLDGLGLPFGLVTAYSITAIEIVGTPLLVAGRCVVYLCPLYAAIYLVGIVLVHAPEGWFAVGLGRNGMEYSVLLIVCLLSVAYRLLPDKRAEG